MTKIVNFYANVIMNNNKRGINDAISKELMELGWSNEIMKFSFSTSNAVNKNPNKDTEKIKKVVTNNFCEESTISNQDRINLKLDPHNAWGL